MPEQVACPSCAATLRVPENLLGKNVKCPKCQTTFRAETQAPAEPEEPEERIANEPPPARSSSRRREAIQEDYDDEPPPEEEDEDRPRRRRRGRSSEAASAVAGPAIALMVVGIIDLVLGVLGLLLRVLGIGVLAAQGAGGPGGGGAGANDVASLAGGVVGNILGLALGGTILLGAMKMKNLQSYGLAMTACIIAIVPCHSCCLLGIPFGIWGIVMLNKPEVKEAFGRNR